MAPHTLKCCLNGSSSISDDNHTHTQAVMMYADSNVLQKKLEWINAQVAQTIHTSSSLMNLCCTHTHVMKTLHYSLNSYESVTPTKLFCGCNWDFQLSRHTGYKPPQQGCRGPQCSCEQGWGEKRVCLDFTPIAVKTLGAVEESRRWIVSRNLDATSPAQLLSDVLLISDAASRRCCAAWERCLPTLPVIGTAPSTSSLDNDAALL